MHDGGNDVEFKLNDKSVCVSEAVYAKSSDSAGGMGGMGGMGTSSITELAPCNAPIPMKKGDKLTVTANFDTIKHPMYVY
jgi:hypothetical protein